MVCRLKDGKGADVDREEEHHAEKRDGRKENYMKETREAVVG